MRHAILSFLLSAGLHMALLFAPLPGDWLAPQSSAPAPKALRLTFAAPRSASASQARARAAESKKSRLAKAKSAPSRSSSEASLGASRENKRRSGETVAASPNPDSADYLARLKEHLIPYRRYPEEARLWRLEGAAHIRFTLNGEGRVLSRALRQSSSHGALDEEALALISRAEPFPPPPLKDGESSMTIILPILFTLRADILR